MIEEGKLGNYIEVFGGQIISRITAKDSNSNFAKTITVVTPKSIYNGCLHKADMAEEIVCQEVDSKKITQIGDLIIKLSSPYDCAIVRQGEEGLVVPSFCAIIRAHDIDKKYLLAFLNSNACKDQLKKLVMGSVVSMIPIGKLREVVIPIPENKDQYKIGKDYEDIANNIEVLRKIINLEQKKNDIIMYDLMDKITL